MSNDLPPEITRQLSNWKRQAGLLRFTNAALGIIASISSLLVAAKINSFDHVIIEWLAFLGAACIGLMTTFNMSDRANRVRNAWRGLNAAVALYESGGDISLEQLVEVYSKSEALIGDVEIRLK